MRGRSSSKRCRRLLMSLNVLILLRIRKKKKKLLNKILQIMYVIYHHLQSIQGRKRKRGSNETFNNALLNLERQRVQHRQKKSLQQRDIGEDLFFFFKSLLPHVRKIPGSKKLAFRNCIQKLVEQFAYQQQSSIIHSATTNNLLILLLLQYPKILFNHFLLPLLSLQDQKISPSIFFSTLLHVSLNLLKIQIILPSLQTKQLWLCARARKSLPDLE